jgi:hydroxypyruvate reductase
VARILAATMQAVEPGAAVRNFVKREEQALQIAGQEIHLEQIRQITILGLGKAAQAMTAPLLEMLADQNLQGLLIPKQVSGQPGPGFEVCPGGHPVPDENSLLAGQKALALVDALRPGDLLICLISGGGSALMSAPLQGVTLTDLRALTSALLGCGARIDEINTLRRHLDRLKGGGLARAAHARGARLVSLILSDVVFNPLEAIASGPTAPDPSTRAEALAVLDKYGLRQNCPAAILHALESAPETPKADDPLFKNVENALVGSNLLAAQAALAQGETEGFQTKLLGNDWQGEARLVARELCRELKRTPIPRPFCLVAGGETTVTLLGKGRGGRNQELALAAAVELAGLPNVMLVSLATDGEDGPGSEQGGAMDAAGALVCGETLARGQERGLDAQASLENNDSYPYFSALGDLLKPGPSGTNVNDLTFLFGF